MFIKFVVKRDAGLDMWLRVAQNTPGRYFVVPALNALDSRMTMRFDEVIGPRSGRTTSDLGLWNGLSSVVTVITPAIAKLEFWQTAPHDLRVRYGKVGQRVFYKAGYWWAQRKLGKGKKAARRVAWAIAKRSGFVTFMNKPPVGTGTWWYHYEVIDKSAADLERAADLIGELAVKFAA
jgi:hypothetical protein